MVTRVLSILMALAIGQCLFAQQSGSVAGSVKDQTGGILRGAAVALTDSDGHAATAKTRTDGEYTFHGVSPGTYSVSATYPGLSQAGAVLVSVTNGQVATANIVMNVESQKQEMNVTESGANQVNTEPANNASALVLRQEDLDALPDDPDDLQADLQALAGPSAGPGGSQIFVDGFTGGRLPPKASIREIRINSNPFSAEYDKLGYGRIEIFTKPGSDKFHGQGYYGSSDGIWNSRNPFLSDNPPFRTQLFGGNISGPLGSKASFFLDVDHRAIDDNGIINAQLLNPTTLAPSLDQSYYPTPQRRTTVSPRVDYRLGANHTLSLRYSYLDNDRLSGVGA
ncbi:MAG TPA: carboxypeptidase-like regulatory domain-containing protein, partial [Bryobacteraceae bacterium]